MKGIVIIGMPCAGKTSCCKNLEKNGLKYYSTGDAVRELAQEELGDNYTSSELGEFSTMKRQEDPAYATKRVLKKAREENLEKVVFEGVRCKEEIDFLRSELNQLLVVYIEVSFEERARRLIQRGREGENSREDMKERDEREKEWGMEEIIQEQYYDVKVDGNCSQEELYKKVSYSNLLIE